MDIHEIAEARMKSYKGWLRSDATWPTYALVTLLVVVLAALWVYDASGQDGEPAPVCDDLDVVQAWYDDDLGGNAEVYSEAIEIGEAAIIAQNDRLYDGAMEDLGTILDELETMDVPACAEWARTQYVQAWRLSIEGLQQFKDGDRQAYIQLLIISQRANGEGRGWMAALGVETSGGPVNADEIIAGYNEEE